MLESVVVTDIINAITVSKPTKRQVEVHRETYGLTLCYEGQITYIHRGKKYLSTPNTAIILPAGEKYSLCCDKAGRFPLINFTTLDKLCDTHIVLPLDNPEPILKDFEHLRHLMLFESNRNQAFSIFYSILHKLQNKPEISPLYPAIKYIENNYNDPTVSNAILAKECNFSEVYFRKLFYKYYKTTPRQYIIDVRLNHARLLLSENKLSVSAVSEECGFSNPYHFSRLFKARTGQTPSEYVKLNLIYKM